MTAGGAAWAASIDWTQPWFVPYRAAGEPLARAVAAGEPLHRALNAAARGAVPEFVPQADLPRGQAYERHVFDSGRCPVRESLHDFFNGLCWLYLPATKRALNRLQAESMAADGIGAVRGPVRDAVTLLDENGALLDAPAPLWEALLARDWQRLFIALRPLWREARLLVLGHAALEKLVHPRKAITVHIYRAQVAIDPIAFRATALDAELAAGLSAPRLAAKPFVPLPVLGIPGWNAGNGQLCFYDDPAVFRPRRAAPERSMTTAPPATGAA